MKLFQKLIDDIKKGENFDLYLAVLLAIVLTTLHLLHLIPIEYLGTLTIVVMAILSYGLLGNRYRLEEILNKVDNKPYSDFLSEFPATFGQKLRDAKEIIIVGTHISSFLTSYHQILIEKLNEGHTIKVLLMKPDGEASKMAVMRFPGIVNVNTENNRIKSSLETLVELKKIYRYNLQIRTLDFLFDYTAYLFDSNILFIERHTFKTSGGSSKPKACYQKEEGKWFEHLSKEVNLLWENSKSWEPALRGTNATVQEIGTQ